ncbi:MAG: aminoacyl-tRNA hydrolase [Candidatus Aenigmatarchaeota archaeon]|nr:aminoacyl-tRNA hydrolase [Nanoarchaeota archaeon]
MEYKQVILIRTDLKMGKGKIAAQVAHAALESYKIADPDIRKKWEETGSRKIIVKVSSLKELMDVYKKAKSTGLRTVLIKDAGKTQIRSGTATAVGIGPDREGKIDEITRNLKLLG